MTYQACPRRGRDICCRLIVRDAFEGLTAFGSHDRPGSRYIDIDAGTDIHTDTVRGSTAYSLLRHALMRARAAWQRRK